MRILRLALAAACTAAIVAVDPWPAQTTAQAEAGSGQLLAALDANMQLEMSGTHWNPDTQTLWVTAGGGSGKGTWALAFNGTTFSVLEYWASPRDEDITQADLAPVSANQHRVYILKEGGPTQIVEGLMTVNPAGNGTATTPHTWTITEIPPNGTNGAEGLCFVPDAWLVANGFVSGTGAAWTASQGGLGGLMFVAHQDGGHVYAIDLAADGSAMFAGKSYQVVGGYKTALSESSALCFDRTIGRLYISHNIGGNRIEITDLTSTATTVTGKPLVTRQFAQLGLVASPVLENPEGFACTPFLTPTGALNSQHFAFFTNDRETIDSAASKARAVVWYQLFDPTVTTGRAMAAIAGSGQSGPVGSALPIAPVVRLRDGRGYPLVGETVTFAVSGGDSVTSSSAVTNGQGVATCGTWRLGVAAGVHALAVSTPLVTSTLSITATATNDPPTIPGPAHAQPSTLVVP